MTNRRFNVKNKWIKWWLFTGVVMIFIQIIIGGITRLTGSGLSITKWEIVTGTLPPLTEEAWDREFDLYKQTPQYEKINQGLNMKEFRFIYFWEYFHRLWARIMGFVFIIPFLWFLFRRQIEPPLLKRLFVVFLLAVLVATFGWIMVASGLIDRPWVNAYKLSMHLGLALICYSYLFWTWSLTSVTGFVGTNNKLLLTGSLIFIFLLSFQILLGGLVSGMRAALVYPTWPDMHGDFIPDVLLLSSEWCLDSFGNYDSGSFMPALVQFSHRMSGYVVAIFGFILSLLLMRKVGRQATFSAFSLLVVLVVQVLLGIITLITAKGQISVLWGILHQGVAIILLSVSLLIVYKLWKGNSGTDVTGVLK